MPCYSYMSNNPVTFVGNVEVIKVSTGPGSYSYSTLTWICEFPMQDQLKIYTRTAEGQPETLLILTTDYTINEGSSNVTITKPIAVGLQIVFRRSTPSDRMIFKFLDGAKLTAKELNASFHQLLFLNQEKEFIAGSKINNFYPLHRAINPWVSGTSYVIGNYVEYLSLIYKCIQATSSIAPGNSSYWLEINTTASPLVVFNGPNPVVLNLTSLAIGKALVWTGTEFAVQNFTGSLSTLSDINTTGAVNGDLLRYNGTHWVKATPSILDITANNLQFKDRVFYDLVTNVAYTNNASGYDVSSKAFLNVFKNGTDWVLTDPPTVYNIVQKMIPNPNLANSQDPETYFNYINTALVGLGANLSNPVKIKFFWDLGAARVNVADINAGSAGTNSYHTYYWDRPTELHSVVGYTPVVGGGATGLLHHGVETSTEAHRVSPYFYEVRNKSTSALVSFVSKVQGYGIKSFYLSIPECYSSPLANIPARSGGNWVTLGTFANLTTQLGAIGGESPVGFTYRDYYLMGLRDMAFAAARPDEGATVFTTPGNLREVDAKTRLLKSAVINVQYNGLDNVDFNRLEEGTTVTTLWKIPRHIIYYNKVACAFANTDSAAFNSNSSFSLNTTRFQGHQSFQDPPTYTGGVFNAAHLVAAQGRGTLFKAEDYWAAWTQKWSFDADVSQNYRFNQADIDWYMYNITDGTAGAMYPSAVNLYKTNAWNPPHTLMAGVAWGQGLETNVAGSQLFPWAFRPNHARDLASEFAIGTCLFNIDANKLFSEAINFLPDPVDEYVFRIVAKKGMTSFFSDATFTKLKTAIILEYGFSDSSTFADKTPLTTLDSIFNRGTQPANKYRADTRIDKSQIKVYVKNESLETVAGNTRYVVTLGIKVPRLKAIGYAKVFRKMFPGSTSNDYPLRDTAAADNEIDSGPWNWNRNWQFLLGTPDNTATTTPYNLSSASHKVVKNDSWSALSTAVDYMSASNHGHMEQNWISGRNECAVKFTRVGIPGDMWIRLSVLNTDGSLDLLDANGFTTAATNEP